MTKKLEKSDLANFTGTENWYRHSIARNILYTDGVQYVAEQGEAYWLIDQIALQQYLPQFAKEPFQVWNLKVDQINYTAVLSCEDGNGNIVYTTPIHFTDFPLEEIRFYVTDNVILLPSEY